jgi:hypothetical protein
LPPEVTHVGRLVAALNRRGHITAKGVLER